MNPMNHPVTQTTEDEHSTITALPTCGVCFGQRFISNDQPCPACQPFSEAAEDKVIPTHLQGLTPAELAAERSCQRLSRSGQQEHPSSSGWYMSGDGQRFFHPRRLIDQATVIRFEAPNRATLILSDGFPFRITDYNVLDLLDAMAGVGIFTPETCDRRKMLCLNSIVADLERKQKAGEEADALAERLNPVASDVLAGDSV